MFHSFLNKKKRSDLLAVNSIDELSRRYKEKIAEISKIVGIQKQTFAQYYRQPINNVLALAQELPASEYHHHCYAGGFIEHVLSTIIYALREKQNIILPINSPPEVSSKLEDTYVYAVFCGAIMHDLGKLITDIEIELYDKKQNVIGKWNSLNGPMTQLANVRYYKPKYRPGRKYKNHESASLLLSNIIPSAGWEWLNSDHDVMAQFLSVFHDHQSDVAKIVKTGDMTSTSKSQGAVHKPIFANERPVHTLFIPTLRKLFDSGELTMNRKGAQAWIKNGYAWCMSKSIIDQIRKTLHSDGHKSVPTDNSRIMDMMSEYSLIELDGDKAIWKVKVSNQDWQPTQFSVLKIPLSTLFPEKQIHEVDEWPGEVQISQFAENTEDVDASEAKTSPGKQDVIESKPAASESQKDDQVSPAKEKPSLTLARDIFKPKSNNENSELVETVTKEEETDLNSTKTEGEMFYSWLVKGIKNKTISLNTAKSFCHTVDLGVGIVSPAAFKAYSEDNWRAVQKSFQAMRVNLKHPKTDENVFDYRVNGKRTVSKLKLWILDNHHFADHKLPSANQHLEPIEE